MIKLFIVWTNYQKFANPLNIPSFANEVGAEALLHLYIKQSDDSILDYLKTTKNEFLNIIDIRSHKVTYNSDTTRTEEETTVTNSFLLSLSTKVFPHINQVSVTLLSAYMQKLKNRYSQTSILGFI